MSRLPCQEPLLAFRAVEVDQAGRRDLVNFEYRDDQGWATDWYGATLLLGDINGGRADVCGRGAGGMFCALSP